MEPKFSWLHEDCSLNWEYCENFIQQHELDHYRESIQYIHEQLHERTGLGGEVMDWIDLPLSDELADWCTEIQDISRSIRNDAEVFVVIGVGGSYLGARAAIEFLRPDYSAPEILFLGQNISPRYIKETLNSLEGKEVYVNVISKSGTTLEPSLSFRIVRRYLEDRYGREEASNRIIATTDRNKGTLKELAEKEGYRTLVVPEGIGGRYSVLTPVGLLPIAVAGINIFELIRGAKTGFRLTSEPDLVDNPAYLYAVIRHILYQKGYGSELMVTYDPYAGYLTEWWKQLYGESEGKDGKGIFPARADFTTDLHSLGQYIQDGRRHLFTTTMWFDSEQDLTLPELDTLKKDDDGLDYLAGTSIQEINRQAHLGTVQAHSSGGVPNIIWSFSGETPYYLGLSFYLFMKACAASGYLLGVNPVDQPGVEAYKKNVKTRLQNLSKKSY